MFLGHEEIVDLLLEAGGDANAKDKNGLTPVISAARNGKQNKNIKISKPDHDHSIFPFQGIRQS